MSKDKPTKEEVIARNRKAKGFSSPADKKRIQDLGQENSQLRMSVLNLRQMYEASVGEKQQLQATIANLQNMLTGAVVNGRGKSIRIKAKSLESLDQYAGLDSKVEDGDLILTALTVEQVEGMQADLGIDEEPTPED